MLSESVRHGMRFVSHAPSLSTCQSLAASTKSLRVQVLEKRLTNELWALREALKHKEIRPLEYVPTELMIADGLTKDAPKLRTARYTSQPRSTSSKSEVSVSFESLCFVSTDQIFCFVIVERVREREKIGWVSRVNFFHVMLICDVRIFHARWWSERSGIFPSHN
jgi:hypothetical protein